MSNIIKKEYIEFLVNNMEIKIINGCLVSGNKFYSEYAIETIELSELGKFNFAHAIDRQHV